MSDYSRQFKSAGFQKQKLLDLMQEREIGAVLLSSPENVFYTTGYTCLPSSGNPILYALRNRLPYYSIITLDGIVRLYCWEFAADGVEFGADKVIGFKHASDAEKLLRQFYSEFAGTGLKLGIEEDCPYKVAWGAADALGAHRLHLVSDLLLSLRVIKSPEEVELIRKSTDIIETTVQELYEVLHTGMRRTDLISEAKLRLIRNGATGISHTTFSYGNENPEVAIAEPLTKGKLVTLDLGCFLEGYASDNRRYAYSGEPPDSLEQTYQTMVKVVDDVGALLVPGAEYRDVFRRAASYYDESHLKPPKHFRRIGHNIGLETEEDWFDAESELTVQTGMVINIEMYAIAPTGEMVGNEETYEVTDNGPNRLSSLPRQIRTVS